MSDVPKPISEMTNEEILVEIKNLSSKITRNLNENELLKISKELYPYLKEKLSRNRIELDDSWNIVLWDGTNNIIWDIQENIDSAIEYKKFHRIDEFLDVAWKRYGIEKNWNKRKWSWTAILKTLFEYDQLKDDSDFTDIEETSKYYDKINNSDDTIYNIELDNDERAYRYDEVMKIKNISDYLNGLAINPKNWAIKKRVMWW